MSANNIRTDFRRLVGEGAFRQTVLTSIAEIIGTSVLVFIGCMGCIGSLGVTPSHLQIAITFGLAVMVVIQCVGHISSAHVNPAITVGSVVLGKKTIPEAAVYLISQVIGAIMGFGVLKIVTPSDRLTSATQGSSDSFCVNDLHADLSPIQGLIIEGIATGILMLVACAIWDSRNANSTDSIPIRFGLTVTALALAVGPYTGCSMNPARSIGPALWNNYWSYHWVYWLGPIGGALLSSFLYRVIFSVKAEVQDCPEAIALNSVDTRK